MLKYRAEKYHIEIFSVTGDVLECAVSPPPETQEAAMALSREQYLFCTDIVDQSVESIAALGASLQDSAVWYFWWD